MSRRNIIKEAQWQIKKYKKFGFTVDRKKGEQFIEALEQINKTPLQWFKEQMEEYLKTKHTDLTDADTTLVNTTSTNTNIDKRKSSPKATHDEVIQWDKRRQEGETWKQIGDSLGRDYNGIRKAVSKLRKINSTETEY